MIPTRSYALLAAPVYRYGFAFHGGFLIIPEGRALRIRSQSERLTDARGSACLPDGKTSYTLVKNVENLSVKFVTLVTYDAGENVSQKWTRSSEIELDKNAVGKNVSVRCEASYDQAIVLGTKCSQVHTEIEGTLVEIKLSGSAILWISLGSVFGFIFIFLGVFYACIRWKYRK